jgi:NAD(P)-dependent dehydrogenase (short-subunit alcohol dehydrogenase family)
VCVRAQCLTPSLTNTRRQTETGNDKLDFMELDLASLDSVRHFAAAFTKRALPLHLLINNAGVVRLSGLLPPHPLAPHLPLTWAFVGFIDDLQAGAMGQLTQDGFEIHMGVNYIGYTARFFPRSICVRWEMGATLMHASYGFASRHFLLTNLLLEDLNTTATKRCVQRCSLSLCVGCTLQSLITLCVVVCV